MRCCCSANVTGYTLPQRRHSSRLHAAAVAEQQYESPELEPLILSDSKTFDEKIAGIGLLDGDLAVAGASAIAAAAARATPPGAAAPRRLRPEGGAGSRAVGQRPGASSRGATLRDEVSKLGVVFVKLAQTLATRPDIGRRRKAAQRPDSNRPFADAIAKKPWKRTWRVSRVLQRRSRVDGVELGNRPPRRRPARPWPCAHLDAPIAAASSPVYKATTANNATVVPQGAPAGVVDQVAPTATPSACCWRGSRTSGAARRTTRHRRRGDGGVVPRARLSQGGGEAARFWDALPKASYLAAVPRAGFSARRPRRCRDAARPPRRVGRRPAARGVTPKGARHGREGPGRVLPALFGTNFPRTRTTGTCSTTPTTAWCWPAS